MVRSDSPLSEDGHRPRIPGPHMQNSHDSDAGGGPESSGLPRREFFREGLKNLFDPVRKFMAQRIEGIRVPHELLRSGEGDPAGDPSPRILRPPGALDEDHFLERCQRSGQCVTACPVHAIQVIEVEEGLRKGTPRIDPQSQACVVCDGLWCMSACPSGALSPVPREEIHMGLAEVHHDICLRTSGEECQICVDKCPIGRRAIEIPYYGARVEVKTDGCVGCGVCEMECPTDPRAIVVRPR